MRMLVCHLVAAHVLGSALAVAADWPNWRGPHYDGISRATNLEPIWSGSPSVLWQRETGSAFSSVTGVGERVYTCGTEDKMQVLFCLDANTGAVVWKRPLEAELEERQGGDGPRATPTIDDGQVYILGARGTLLCADARTGEQRWTRSFQNKPRWAYSGSVLIEGDLAVVSPGGDDGALLALDKHTGQTRWQAGTYAAAYATPYPFTLSGKRYLVGFMAKEAIIVDAQTGQEVWKTTWETSYDVNASTPIFHDGYLFLSSGYGKGCALFRIEQDGDQLKGETVWQNENIRNKFQTSILIDGKLYGADEQSLRCVDFMTGKVFWEQDRLDGTRTSNGTVACAQGYLFFLDEKGTLYVAEVSPNGFEPRAHVELVSGRCWTVPTIHNGRLYARDFNKVVCLDLRRPD